MEARHWGRHLGEMVLIVASILLAFALDSWWDERRERVDEQAILHALHDEFKLKDEVVSVYRGRNDRSIQSLEFFLGAIEAGRWVTDEVSPDAALAWLMLAPTPDVASGVLNALISSGRIEILENSELKIRLSKWESVLTELLDDLEPSKAYAWNTVIPHLVNKGIPVISAFDSVNIGASSQVPRYALADDPELLASLLSDPSFRTLVEVRLGVLLHADEEYDAVQKELDGILAILTSELE